MQAIRRQSVPVTIGLCLLGWQLFVNNKNLEGEFSDA